jgi:PAS domain S-box-containing protein
MVGTYILFARPGDTAARLLFLVALSLLPPLTLHFQTVILLSPTLFVLESGLKILASGLLFSSFLHLFLLFPVTKGVARGREKWLRGLHLVNPLASGGIGILWGDSPAQRLALTQQISSLIGLVMLLASIAAIVHTYATVREPTSRSQIRWIAWGCAVGLLPYALLTGIPEAITGRGILPIEVTAFFVAVLPLAIAIAVARYRLFDINTVIHRSLLYGILMLLLAGLYLLMLWFLGAVLVRFTGQPSDTLVVFISTLIVSTAFWLLRSSAARLINRLFYRTRPDPQQILTEMSIKLGSAIQLEEVADLLTRVIPHRVGSPHGGLMAVTEDRSEMEVVSGTPLTIPTETVLEVWAEHNPEPILRSLPPEWFPAEALELMEERDVELLIPLLVGDEMVGLWTMRPRRSGVPYTTEETRALAALGRQAAVAVQNSQLVRRLEEHRQSLETEVGLQAHGLERERNRLNAILQNMADGLLVTSTDGRVLLVNPAFEEMMRRPARVMIGRPIEQALYLPTLANLVLRTAPEAEGRVVTADLERHDHVFKASSSALRDGSGIITVLRDITVEVEVDRMKTEFISTVSHELRTPLTSVLGFAKLIRRTLENSILPELDSERTLKAANRIADNLDIVVTEGERLTRLINDVLDIAKMEANKVDWDDRPIDVADLVELTVQSTASLATAKGLALTAQVPSGLPILTADPDRVRQVITNLISNAVKFTDQGEITVTAELLPASSSLHRAKDLPPASPAILVSVADTGVGIAREDLQRLFLRFQQLGTDGLTDKPVGTGLGLAICREIVTHYRGAIWAESHLGQGTTFKFALPVEEMEVAVPSPTVQPEQAAAAEPAPFSLQRQVARALILIADDEPAIRRLLSQTLEDEGYRTIVVSTGADAVDLARRRRPDLILLDVMMPGISGFDVLQILRSDPDTAKIPVMILSMVENRQRGLALGADAYLTKPIDRVELLDTIVGLLSTKDSGGGELSGSRPPRTLTPEEATE